MRVRRFIQADVLTSKPTRGNGLAVVMGGAGYRSAHLRAIP